MPDSETEDEESISVENLSDISTNPAGNIYNKPKDNTKEIGIEIRGVIKGYYDFRKNVSVLNGVFLKCFKGDIYVLYGSKDSGKSTLVKVVLSLVQYDTGSVEIFGKSYPYIDANIKIGYMPENDGLFDFLTVFETIYYFGYLLGLSKKEILARTLRVNAFLSVFNLNVLVKSLLNFQKRLLSFYVSTLNNIDILIIDDVTFDIDPFYKYELWLKIKKLSTNENVTIFLTTTDIQDCENADMMGYLRNGRIIEESNPTKLMEKYNVNTIAKLSYCIVMKDFELHPILKVGKAPMDSKSVNSLNAVESGGFIPTDTNSLQTRSPTRIQFLSDTRISYIPKKITRRNRFFSEVALPTRRSKTRKVCALFRKEILLIVRNRRRLLKHVILPIICILLHYFTMGRTPQNLRMGIFNLESNANSCNNLSLLSCEMISYIDTKYIKFEYFSNWDDCHKKGVNGDLVGIMLISENMTIVFSSYGPNFRSMQDFKTKVNSRIIVYVELLTTSKFINNFIMAHINTAYNKLLDIHLSDWLRGDSFIHSPITYNETYFDNMPHPDGAMYTNVWAIYVLLSHTFAAFLGSVSLAEKYEQDIIDRFFVLGVTMVELHIVHCTTQLILACLLNLLFIVIMLLITEFLLMPLKLLKVWLVIFFNILSGSSFGFVIYIHLKHRHLILQNIIVMETVLYIISGILWPYEALPVVIQQITKIFPHVHVVRAIEYIVIKELPLQNYYILLAIVISFIWTVVFVTIAIISMLYYIKE